jgi:hypothetical protein
MANDKPKVDGKIITIHEGRVSFYNAVEPKYRTDKFGRPDKGTPDRPKKPQYRMTWLLDPSNAQAATTIREIKAEASRVLDLYFGGRDKWPKDNPTTGRKGILSCFGNGNDLPKVYDGYKDMFYIKVADAVAPVIGDRRGRQVVFVTADNAWHVVDRETGQTTEEVVEPGAVPYAGCYARGRIRLYPWEYEGGGVNANFMSVQFVRPGDAFGGGGRRNAAEELQEMAGDSAPASAVASEGDPW